MIYKIEEYKNGKFDGRNIEYDYEGNIQDMNIKTIMSWSTQII